MSKLEDVKNLERKISRLNTRLQQLKEEINGNFISIKGVKYKINKTNTEYRGVAEVYFPEYNLKLIRGEVADILAHMDRED